MLHFSLDEAWCSCVQEIFDQLSSLLGAAKDRQEGRDITPCTKEQSRRAKNSSIFLSSVVGERLVRLLLMGHVSVK